MERCNVNLLRDIVYRLRQGEGVKAVSRELGLARNTVRKYQRIAAGNGWLDVSAPLLSAAEMGKQLGPAGKGAPRTASSVAPHGDMVRELVEQNVETMAIWQRLKDRCGYTGSYSSVRRFAARLRPARPEAVCRVETAPGEQAQVDFVYGGLQRDPSSGAERKVWAFVMTLSWSRHQYVEFVYDQRMATWLGCHERAFKWFGGAPARVVIDNLKAAVKRLADGEAVLAEPYRRLAQHYGFIISPTRPRTPRHKGIVESGARYVKRNFLAGETFASLDERNARARKWAMETAGRRIHGTAQAAPLDRFESVERAALRPLPPDQFEPMEVYLLKVQRDCHVTVQRSAYSVPYEHAGKQAEVHVKPRMVEIFINGVSVVSHNRAAGPGQRVTHLDHYPEGKQKYFENTPERCRERARAAGPECLRLAETWLGDSVQDRLRSVQRLLRLAETYGPERLEAACARASHYGDTAFPRIRSILESGSDKLPLAEARPPQAAPSGPYVFARQAGDFFPEAGRC